MHHFLIQLKEEFEDAAGSLREHISEIFCAEEDLNNRGKYAG
jgi:hypothetical protein